VYRKPSISFVFPRIHLIRNSPPTRDRRVSTRAATLSLSVRTEHYTQTQTERERETETGRCACMSIRSRNLNCRSAEAIRPLARLSAVGGRRTEKRDKSCPGGGGPTQISFTFGLESSFTEGGLWGRRS
jgi:hypothetical protein